MRITILILMIMALVQQSDDAIMQRGIRDEARKIGIRNLKDTAQESGTEIRVWVGFGLLYPRCFIMTERNGRREAFHITAKRSANGISTPKVMLTSPKSGWNEFADFIKQHGVDSPLKLSLDKQSEFDPDEEAVVIEVMSNGKYDMVFYDYDNTSGDGRKAIAVCRKLDQEFGIQMACPPAR